MMIKHLGDITKVNGAEIPVVDIITGGSPCQDLSVAGLRKGLQHGELGDEETTRSGLFMDQLRIVKEMRAKDVQCGRNGLDVRPRWMVFENVPGVFSSNGGKDFQVVLTEVVRVVEPDALLCLCLKTADGRGPDASMEWTDNGLLPTNSTMLSTGEFHSVGNGFVSLPTSTALPQQRFSLTLNLGEMPRVPNPTKLSQILEQNVDPKYHLSAKACQGILNRAERRGKKLPEALLKALTEQAACPSKTPDTDGGTKATLPHQ